MGGRKSKNKGSRIEREIVALHKELGVDAQRVPLSGAAGGHFSGDVDIYLDGPDEAPWCGEVKARKDGAGFKVIEAWLGDDNDILFLRRNNATPLVVLPWASWVRLIKRCNVVYHLQCGNQLGPLQLRKDGAMGAFNFLDRAIAVQSDDQEIAKFFCLSQQMQVPTMQQVKTAIGENDFLALRFGLSDN